MIKTKGGEYQEFENTSKINMSHVTSPFLNIFRSQILNLLGHAGGLNRFLHTTVSTANCFIGITSKIQHFSSKTNDMGVQEPFLGETWDMARQYYRHKSEKNEKNLDGDIDSPTLRRWLPETVEVTHITECSWC